MRQRTISRKIAALVVCCVSWGAQPATGQTITVPELLQQEKEWDGWLRQKKHIHIDGRYGGRFSRQFRLEKLSILMQPGRNVVLPASLDGGQRMTVSGYLAKTGSRYQLNVDRIAVGSTDADRIRERLRRLPKDKPAEAFALADEYEPNVEFYEDEDLAAEIAKIRTDAFTTQRQLVKNDAASLQTLIATGKKLGVPNKTLESIAFQAIVVLSKQSPLDTRKLIALLSKLPGWDRPSAFLDSQFESRFLANPVKVYEAADQSARLRMNRRFYRTIRLSQIVQAAQPDGSNGDEIAGIIRKELPEELSQAKNHENAYIEFQLSRVGKLTRGQLQDLDVLLKKFDRGNDMEAAVESWLKAQQQRLENGQLDGSIATAEEYMFAFDTWKQPRHRKVASDYLKKAFAKIKTSAPGAAAEIEARLKTLGWIWLHDRWMTTDEANNLPDDDAAKAMIEGRVVAGMSAQEVVELLGEPSRKIRVVSTKGVHAIWVFGQKGMTATVVHLSRTRFQSPKEAVATYVAVDRR